MSTKLPRERIKDLEKAVEELQAQISNINQCACGGHNCGPTYTPTKEST